MPFQDDGYQDKIIELAYKLPAMAAHIDSEQDFLALIQALKKVTAAVDEDIKTLGSILSDTEWQKKVQDRVQQINKNTDSLAGDLLRMTDKQIKQYLELWHKRHYHLKELNTLIEALELHKPLLSYKGQLANDVHGHEMIKKACEQLVKTLNTSLAEEG